MKKLLQFLIIISVSLFMTSCYYDAFIELPDDGGGIVPPTDISFKSDIEPLFVRCAGCHNGTQNPDLREGNAYNAIVPRYVIAGDADDSELFNKLPGIGHPIDVGFSLSADQIATIKGWINQGALNN
jgi:hypothetical protein